jgi:serine O-acetyltransferase
MDKRRYNRGLLEPGIWPVIIYRYGAWTRDHVSFKPLRQLLLLSYYCIRLPIEFATGVQIGLGAKIGPGLCVHNYGDIHIAHRCVIGKCFTINDGVSIMSKGPNDGWRFPVIGDRVYVASGAKILGGIKIGNNVVIGANSVVIRDVPDNVIVGGSPANIISSDIDSWRDHLCPKNF